MVTMSHRVVATTVVGFEPTVSWVQHTKGDTQSSLAHNCTVLQVKLSTHKWVYPHNIFSNFYTKIYYVGGNHYKCLTEALMSDHNMFLCGNMETCIAFQLKKKQFI